MLRLRDCQNRGRRHLFLGGPMSADVDKTVVEPGCAFSPGLWTLGISVAVRSGEIVAPQERDLPMAFDGDRPPVVVSRYAAGAARVENRLVQIDGVDYFASGIQGDASQAAVVISDMGPAGGKIDEIEWNEQTRTLTARRKSGLSRRIQIRFETPVLRAEIVPPDETHDSPFALLYFEGEARLCVVHARHLSELGGREESPALLSVEEAFRTAQRRWDESLPAKIFAPDERIAKAWEQCAFHMISAMEYGQPRIGVANYPVFWIRDCVIVLRALDLMGRSDLARIGCDALAPLLFSGGFGSEADNPGEGIWALMNHYRITRDRDWLASVYPFIRERVQWLIRMLETQTPIHLPGNSRSVYGMSHTDSTLVCLPRQGHHIHGRMDWHCPDFYINCWAYAGLEQAAQAAKELGDGASHAQWSARAEALDQAIAQELLPDYGNERDSCVTPYPTGALAKQRGALRAALDAWYTENRLTPDGARRPEKQWTYFEAAQIHNMILCGEVEKAWVCLDGFLSEERKGGMFITGEGEWNHTEMLPYGNGAYGRGWLQEGADAANMPHNWTTAETALMLRSLFVVEEENGLSLLGGVPGAWKKTGAVMGVEALPTRFGTVSFRARVNEAGGIDVTFTQGGQIPWHLAEEKADG